MIRLYNILLESTEESALDYLSRVIKDGPYAGKVFLAGGAVRDEILNVPIKDIDIVVTLPNGGIEFAEWITKKIGAYRKGSNPIIYPTFGTAKFNFRGINYHGTDLSNIDIEAVMTRGEKYERGSRKPEVVYADLNADAERRDLTVNALYKNLTTGEILDPTGRGIDDIKKGIIRTPLDPDTTFEDDPLRMLRAVRFATKYDWKMSKTLVESMKRNADKLKNISTERIQDELNKILMTDRPDQGMKLLSYTGLNKYIIPELDDTRGVGQNEYHKDDVFSHTLEVLKNTGKNLTARLAALFHDIGKPDTKTTGDDGRIHFYDHETRGAEMAKTIMHRLRYSNEDTDSVSRIVGLHMKLKQSGVDGSGASDKTLRKFMAAVGDDLEPAVLLMQADNISHSHKASMPDQIPRLYDRMKQLGSQQPNGSKVKLPINGNDIIKALDLKPGPIIKALLKKVEDAWFENPSMSADDAMDIVNKTHEKLVSIGIGTKKPESPVADKGDISPDILNQRVRNPETGQDILVRSALDYDDDHPAKIAALKLVKR
jgi:poly(A) polymerase